MIRTRRDSTERAIVAALRKLGATVITVTGATKAGAPDLFVAWQGRWFALEAKSEHGILSPEQQVLAGRAPVAVVKSVAEALDAIGVR